jgi:hypothetical protein
MDGERAYTSSTEIAEALGVKFRPWSELTPDERIAWAEIAHESTEADRLTLKPGSGTI